MHSKRNAETPQLDPLPWEGAHGHVRGCDHPGCERAGEFRAPKGRERLREYFWFCLDHVRAYNKAWDYCAGMSAEEVEALLRTDTCWQRPTWPLGDWRTETDLRDRARRAFGLGGEPHAGNGTGRDESRANGGAGHPPRPRTEEEQALDVLDLNGPVDFATIRARWKTLVKRHHPDANGGSREAEEKLKRINRAYGTLKASYAPS